MTIQRRKWLLFLSTLITVSVTAPVFADDTIGTAADDSISEAHESVLRALPLAFEQNLGQSHPRVRFIARGAAFDAFLTDEGANVVAAQLAQDRRSVVQ